MVPLQAGEEGRCRFCGAPFAIPRASFTKSSFEGERGVISYYKNQQIKKELVKEKEMLVQQLAFVEKKNSLYIL